jgi:hypothetical protein
MTEQRDNRWLGRFTGLGRGGKREDQVAPKSPYRQRSRANRRSLVAWQDDAAIKALKHLAVELGTTQQALIAEGINMVLAKYSKPTAATWRRHGAMQRAQAAATSDRLG